ncbi:hypothetical protein Tco_0774629 [Tanacetum coccineum]|uniref:Uncharacterized protein n=1 Tax=Tanacetum coccineum TaxID=301880 RepID=A0ABQ4ZP14_9ASTR
MMNSYVQRQQALSLEVNQASNHFNRTSSSTKVWCIYDMVAKVGIRPCQSRKMKGGILSDDGLGNIMVHDQFWIERNASRTLQPCMVSIIGGFKRQGFYIDDSHLKETAEQLMKRSDYRSRSSRFNRTNQDEHQDLERRKMLTGQGLHVRIQKRLIRPRRIFRNLESFVGGRIREGDYRLIADIEVKYLDPSLTFHFIVDVCFETFRYMRTGKYGELMVHTSDDLIKTYTGNPVKEILLRLKLPDHSIRSSWIREDQLRWKMETPRSSGVNSPPNVYIIFQVKSSDNEMT